MQGCGLLLGGIVVASCAMAGVVGLGDFSRGLRLLDERAVRPTALVLMAVFTLVGSQMSWTLRPFLVRPRSEQPPIVRQVEGGFFDAVARSGKSAMGIYDLERKRFNEGRQYSEGE
jgi:hypothetical protein